MKSLGSTRRRFLQAAALGSVGVPMFARHLLSAPPSNKIRHASFGAAGMAGSDMVSIGGHQNVQLVCVAEVDQSRLGMLKQHFGDQKVAVYQDWRRMLDKEGKHLDSVNVGTPDHMHAPMAMSAMQLGLHAYVQKPLAHDIYEVRRLTEVAREKKLVTQMGIQIHSAAYYRIAVKLVHQGAIGKVVESHSWSSKKWGDKGPPPNRQDPIPPGLDWDLWIGVCQPRPYIEGYYHPGNWRKRLDFGTGTFGDMGCHIFDPVFEALGLQAPLTVRSEGPAPDQWNWAINAVIHYEFPGSQYTADKTVKVHWYDGDQRPPKEVQELLEGKPLPDQGSIIIGTKGVLLIPHVAVPVLFPQKEFKDYKLPRDPGTSHTNQFVEAILGKTQTSAPFDYSGPLTEAVLLGGVATRFPKTTLEWDSANLRFKNSPEATALLRREYRKGWEVPGLS